MCDFSSPPDVLININTNQIILEPFKGYLNGTTYESENRHYKDTNGLEQGLYYICATGSHYNYWNGTSWESVYTDNWKMFYDKNKVPHMGFGSYNYVHNDKHYNLIEDKPGYQTVYRYEKTQYNDIFISPRQEQNS